MSQLARQASGRYRPITKTLDISDARVVLSTRVGCATADDLMEAAVPLLPHAGRGRRRDVVRLARIIRELEKRKIGET